jgi:hypothetical protein
MKKNKRSKIRQNKGKEKKDEGRRIMPAGHKHDSDLCYIPAPRGWPCGCGCEG